MSIDTQPAPVGHFDGETLLRQEDMLERLRADRHRLIEEANEMHSLCDRQRITINNLEAEVAALRADVAVLSERIRRDSAAETRRVDQMMDAFVGASAPAWHYRRGIGTAAWERATNPGGPWESCPPRFRDQYATTEEAN